MALIDGKEAASRLLASLAADIARIEARRGRPPALHVVLVGDDPASEIYVRNKSRDCRKSGIVSCEHRLPATTGQEALLDLVRALGNDDAVDGLIVQLPLPGGLDPDPVIRAIDPAKDVDGFHPANLGNLLSGRPGLRPCTPTGCLRLIDGTGTPLEGRRAVVVGRSIIVGKPMALMLLERNATVTICHSRTTKLDEIVAGADLVVAAVGRPGMIRGAWIKTGAVVVDVGMNRLPDGTFVGDVEFPDAAKRAAWITPVPGGVGPMTRACLLANTVEAALGRSGLARP